MPALTLRAAEGKLRRRLRPVAVTLLQFTPSAVLECDACGQCWSPNCAHGGRFPRGYWRCPNGCAEVLAEAAAEITARWRREAQAVAEAVEFLAR